MLRTALSNVVYLLFAVWSAFRIAHWWGLPDNDGVMAFYGVAGTLCALKCAVAAVDIWMEWRER